MAKIQRKKGLGRGLSAILPDTEEVVKEQATGHSMGVGEIAIDQIEMVNQFQPRTEFDEKALEELSASIKVHGVIQPLTVRKLETGKYQLIAGERRMRAAKLAKLKKVPAFIRAANDEQMLEMALIENIQREDLNPIEIAISFRRMIDELKLKQEDLGKKVGKNRSTVTNYLSLLKLPSEIMNGVRNRKISLSHAKELVLLKDKNRQLDIYYQIIAKGLSVRQVEKLCREEKELAKASQEAEKPSAHQIQLSRVEQELTHKFGNKIKLKQSNSGKGEIAIPFNSTEDLNRILEILEL
ncbi:MAG: ParB/RepB/Spo0J family partition protein [Bacteroidota bacterium]